VQGRLLELLAAERVGLDGFELCLHHPQGVVPELTRACDFNQRRRLPESHAPGVPDAFSCRLSEPEPPVLGHLRGRVDRGGLLRGAQGRAGVAPRDSRRRPSATGWAAPHRPSRESHDLLRPGSTGATPVGASVASGASTKARVRCPWLRPTRAELPRICVSSVSPHVRRASH
jgi:hypothetical protein